MADTLFLFGASVKLFPREHGLDLTDAGEKSHGGDFSYVGIDAILEQMRRKAMKQGFELNLMVVGEL
uniref:Uncharacterized protein n=1 Tax=Xiphophorus couchianus TaxID=32473 RepID=A0A3B5M8D9_9TELE